MYENFVTGPVRRSTQDHFYHAQSGISGRSSNVGTITSSVAEESLDIVRLPKTPISSFLEKISHTMKVSKDDAQRQERVEGNSRKSIRFMEDRGQFLASAGGQFAGSAHEMLVRQPYLINSILDDQENPRAVDAMPGGLVSQPAYVHSHPNRILSTDFHAHRDSATRNAELIDNVTLQNDRIQAISERHFRLSSMIPLTAYGEVDSLCGLMNELLEEASTLNPSIRSYFGPLSRTTLFDIAAETLQRCLKDIPPSRFIHLVALIHLGLASAIKLYAGNHTHDWNVLACESIKWANLLVYPEEADVYTRAVRSLWESLGVMPKMTSHSALPDTCSYAAHHATRSAIAADEVDGGAIHWGVLKRGPVMRPCLTLVDGKSR